MQCHSLPVGHKIKCDETYFHKCVNSLAVCHMKRCDETASQTTCNVTHFLLVVGNDVMRLLLQTVQCHTQAVDHRNRCDEATKMCNVTHKL